uniref:hypothetical protein n=1 Tax=Alistipes sp. TaxID=1872444 RepID=UPI00405614D8
MKQQIDHLIANTLLDEGEVYLPEVGILILYRHSAKLLSKRELKCPYRELRLTKEARCESITANISRVANVTTERAEDIYAEWLEQSLHNGILTINGLCTIEGNKIMTDKTFEVMANPKGRGSVKINPRTNYFIYVLAGVCMGFAVGIAAYILYANGAFDKLFAKRQVAPASAAFETVVEVPEQTAEPAIEPTSTPTSTPAVEQSSEQIVEPVSESVAEVTILPMQKGCSYAVWGVYNELKNAEDAINWLATHIPEIDGANIYEYDGRYMVALCEVTSRSECGRKVSAWKTQYKSCKSVWVYTR